MSIPLTREPPDMGALERCCFCRKPTPMWTAMDERVPGEQVACCDACAETRTHEDVPSKREWCGIERAIRRAAGWRT